LDSLIFKLYFSNPLKLKSLFILLLALSLIFTGCKTESSSEEDSYIGSELENEYPSIDNLIKKPVPLCPELIKQIELFDTSNNLSCAFIVM